MKKISSFLIIFSLVLSTAGVLPLKAMATPPDRSNDEDPKVNICHATSSENNPWNAININQSALQEHLDLHGDFLYNGPVKDNGHPSNDEGDQWCEDNAPKTTDDVKICKTDETEKPLSGWTLNLNGTNEGQNDYSAVTGEEDGCVTFEDVPYGDYTVGEVMKEDWENVSGLGEVTVPTEGTLVVVNKKEKEERVCLKPNIDGNGSENIVLGQEPEGEQKLQTILDNAGYSLDALLDQNGIDEWTGTNNTENFVAKFIKKQAGASSVFGYYLNNDLNTFSPVYKEGDHPDFPAVPSLNEGESLAFSVPNLSTIGFAISVNYDGIKLFATKKSLNENSDDHAITYGPQANKYVIAFEDVSLSYADKDYNDLVTEITVECEDVPPPVVEYNSCGVVLPQYSETVIPNGYQTNPATYDYIMPTPNPFPGDFVDHDWVQVFSSDEGRVVWDMGAPTDTVYLIPSIDHGPTPDEAHEVTLYGSNNPTGPWVAGVETLTYPAGPTNWISDDDSTSWKFTQPYKYVSAIGGGTLQNDGDGEIDAICSPEEVVVPPPVDVCPNLQGDQATVPEGKHLDNEGQCVPNEVVIVDVCSNIPENQATVPQGMHLNESNECVPNVVDEVDACPLMEGFQASVPEEGCENDTDDVVDVCANIEGDQSEVPSGKIQSGEDCVDPTNIVDPSTPSGGGGGGGGGGGNGGNGPVNFGFVLGSGAGQVLGESCGLYMSKYLKFGSNKNSSEQVKKLQEFLNKWLDANIPVTGFFGSLTLAKVKEFQSKYSEDILKPWELDLPTGLVYIATITKMNNLECPDLLLPLPPLVPWSQNSDI